MPNPPFTIFKRQQRLKASYREVFASEAGQLVLADLARFCGAGADMVGETSDLTHYNCGKYRVLQRIVSLLESDDRAVMRLVRADTDREDMDARA